MSSSASDLPLFTRLWFAWLCLLRVLFDGAFAGRVWAVKDRMPELPPAPELEAEPEPEPEAGSEPEPRAALALLALLQREGRLVDFLEQDIGTFDDADVGAAARVVHEGCRKALHAHAAITTVRSEDEEATVEVTSGIDTGEIKLTGKVVGEPPYQGVLRHRGWRVKGLSLPKPLDGHDHSVVAPAEVEL